MDILHIGLIVLAIAAYFLGRYIGFRAKVKTLDAHIIKTVETDVNNNGTLRTLIKETANQ